MRSIGLMAGLWAFHCLVVAASLGSEAQSFGEDQLCVAGPQGGRGEGSGCRAAEADEEGFAALQVTPSHIRAAAAAARLGLSLLEASVPEGGEASAAASTATTSESEVGGGPASSTAAPAANAAASGVTSESTTASSTTATAAATSTEASASTAAPTTTAAAAATSTEASASAAAPSSAAPAAGAGASASAATPSTTVSIGSAAPSTAPQATTAAPSSTTAPAAGAAASVSGDTGSSDHYAGPNSKIVEEFKGSPMKPESLPYSATHYQGGPWPCEYPSMNCSKDSTAATGTEGTQSATGSKGWPAFPASWALVLTYCIPVSLLVCLICLWKHRVA